MWPAKTEVMVFPLCPHAATYKKMLDVSLRTRPQNSLVAGEDVKKPTK